MPDPAAWRTADGADVLASAALAAAPVSAATEAGEAERSEFIQFVPAGTVATGGRIVVASGRLRAPAEVRAGESPVVLDHPDTVRGVLLSSYGLARPVDGRAGF
jgi:hypothetical protein